MLLLKYSQTPVNVQALIIFHTEEGLLSYNSDAIERLYNKLKESKVLSDEKGTVNSNFVELNGSMVYLIFVGVGENKKITNGSMQRSAYIGMKECLKYKPNAVAVCLFDESNSIQQQKVVEGVIFADYHFDRYHFEQKEPFNCTIELVKKDGVDTKAIELGEIIAHTIFDARDLVNTPANDMTPNHLAEYVLQNQSKGYTAEIFDEHKIQELNMGAFYAVARGSDHAPRLIVMKYNGCPQSKETLALIGKGLTYDSGGYSLKNTSGMRTMKCDMGGAASVIAAISILAQTKASVNVIAVVAACENLISGHSYKPGDIIRSMSGKYIEIDNTDAEGRLTLIDAVTYAIREQKVTAIVDVATLTGAAVAALGKEYTAVVTNEDKMWNLVCESSEASGDKVWRLPFDENLGKLNKSEIADLKNSGGSFAGTSTAGMFIGEFIEEKLWVHLDIAGPAFVEDDKVLCSSSATGIPTSLLCEFAQRYFKNLN